MMKQKFFFLAALLLTVCTNASAQFDFNNNNTGHFVATTSEQAEQVRRMKESAQQGANEALGAALLESQRHGSSSRSSNSVNKSRFNKDIDREVKAYRNAHSKGATGSDHRYYNNIKKNNDIRYGSKRRNGSGLK